MATSISMNFDRWLSEQLEKLEADVEVFSPYIKGILDTDETIQEKKESLEEVLSSITVSFSMFSFFYYFFQLTN